MLKITKGLKPFVEGDEITTYTDDRGDEYVRVKIDKEDFCIAAHDYVKDGDDAFKWDDAMKSLEEDGLTMFTKKHAEIYNKYFDDINSRLEDIGGDALSNDWYWTTTKEDANYVWAYNGYINIYNFFLKKYTFRVRPIFVL